MRKTTIYYKLSSISVLLSAILFLVLFAYSETLSLHKQNIKNTLKNRQTFASSKKFAIFYGFITLLTRFTNKKCYKILKNALPLSFVVVQGFIAVIWKGAFAFFNNNCETFLAWSIISYYQANNFSLKNVLQKIYLWYIT